jgi:hypothetical protein
MSGFHSLHGYLKEHVYGAVITPIIVAIIFALVGPTRRAITHAASAVWSWLGEDIGVDHWLLVVLAVAGVVAGVLLGRTDVGHGRISSPGSPPERPAALNKAQEDATVFRDEFVEMLERMLGARFDVAEGHNHPDDFQEEYAERRRRLLELHDRVGPSLREWIERRAERRYDIASLDDQDAANYYGGNIDLASTPPDEPYTQFFEAAEWDGALDSARGLDGGTWSDVEFRRQIRRRQEALDAYVRSLEL